jgi:hypothetical protein
MARRAPSTEELVDRIARVLEELGGEASFAEIRTRVLAHAPTAPSGRSLDAHRVALALHQHSDGRGTDRFEKVRADRFRLKETWSIPSHLSDER